MNIELKKIDKDALKVGDVVGVAREVGIGYMSIFRHGEQGNPSIQNIERNDIWCEQ